VAGVNSMGLQTICQPYGSLLIAIGTCFHRLESPAPGALRGITFDNEKVANAPSFPYLTPLNRSILEIVAPMSKKTTALNGRSRVTAR
jgi:hypothetical protein